MIQIYYGDGKGKTTAAIGSAIRASGSNMKILFTQFFKNGETSEILPLMRLSNIKCCFPKEEYTLFQDFDRESFQRLSLSYNILLDEVVETSKQFDMIIFDEILEAYSLELIDRKKMLSFLQEEKQNREIILTGHKKIQDIINIADYVSEIRMIKHPFNNSTPPRKGIEY